MAVAPSSPSHTMLVVEHALSASGPALLSAHDRRPTTVYTRDSSTRIESMLLDSIPPGRARCARTRLPDISEDTAGVGTTDGRGTSDERDEAEGDVVQP